MRVLQKAFTNELKHFDKLGKQGQTFITSIFLYNVTHPVYSVFISAFIWRQSQDFSMVALYNLAVFCGLPVGFYINGYLLKRNSVKRLYFSGALLRALCLILLVSAPVITGIYIAIFGMLLGLISGIFWSNRNLLNVKLTNPHNRIYFSSLEFISSTLTGIFVPMLIGIFIVYGTTQNLYTPLQGYYAVIGLTIAITVFLSLLIKNITVTTPAVPNVIHRKASKQWNNARGLVSLYGLMNGIFQFLPILLVLNFLGQEDILGIVQSVAAVITGLMMYSIARSINNRYRVFMVAVSVALSIVAAALLAFVISPVTIFIFVALITMSQQLLYTEAYAIIFDLIDRENPVHDHRYSFVFDIELFLNIGRITGIILFFYFIYSFSTNFAVQYTPLIFAFAQIILILLAKTIEDKNHVLRHNELAASPVIKNDSNP